MIFLLRLLVGISSQPPPPGQLFAKYRVDLVVKYYVQQRHRNSTAFCFVSVASVVAGCTKLTFGKEICRNENTVILASSFVQITN